MTIGAIINPGRLRSATEITIARIAGHRELLYEQLKREVFGRHAGQVAGLLWLLIHPLFQMMVYVVLFAVVFRVKFGGDFDLPLDYSAYILSGIIPWLSVQLVLTRTSTALTENAKLIKQVIFPIEILPAKAVLASFIPLAVSLLIYVAYVLIMHGALPWTYALLPFLIVLHLTMALGLGLLLSTFCVFVRDIRELVQMFALVGALLAPTVYLPQWVPAVLKPVIYLNPFSYLIWCYRDVLFFGRIEHPWAWLFLVTFSTVVLVIGARAFQALKGYFGDAL